MALPGITCPNTQENLVLESCLQLAVRVVGRTHARSTEESLGSFLPSPAEASQPDHLGRKSEEKPPTVRGFLC